MYGSKTTTKFKRDVKLCKKQGKDMDKFKTIHEALILGKSLPIRNKDHFLTGSWHGYRECHIEPDWLLIYLVNEQEKLIEYVRMGSHSNLFC